MTVAIHLLGRPSIDPAPYRYRSRKSWALLAYLILQRQPQPRSRLAELLFAEAADPLRALRWNLSEVRRSLGENGSVDGDPVVLQLPPDAVVDVHVVAHGSWTDAVTLPGLGGDLLDGLSVAGAPAFESWLLSERRRLAAAAEAILHEAALGSMSRGDLDTAREHTVRAAQLSPLDENHQALLIRLYRLAGDNAAAERQFAACVALFDRELGVAPGPAVKAALRQARPEPDGPADEFAIAAVVEAGSAAVSAGAVETGVISLRTAVRLADAAGATRLQVEARLVLAEALIHTLRGFDEEGLALLFEADRIAVAAGDLDGSARARVELGYVDFLRARYDRAEFWLSDARTLATGSPAITAKALTYLGSVASDRADYLKAAARLTEATALSRSTGEARLEAYGLSMLGRISLLLGEPDAAAEPLDAAVALATREHWLSFLPWPQALLGEVYLAHGDLERAEAVLSQAFARACQLGDPCWEGMSTRGLALVAEARGETEQAFELLADARVRCNRLADPYVWLDAYILDAQCTLGRQHGHPQTKRWVDDLHRLASRTGMRIPNPRLRDRHPGPGFGRDAR
jgi:DNA-binding SARP family transcriptional activator